MNDTTEYVKASTITKGSRAMNEDTVNKVKEFLKEYPSPSVVIATTIRDGCVTCISPIHTICGAELICSEKTRDRLDDLINGKA